MSTKGNEEISEIKYANEEINDLKINRWIVLVIYSIVASIGTFVHGGFSGWQPIIYKSGAFIELCKEGDVIESFRVDENNVYDTCGNRDAAVNNLFTISFFVHFFLSSISGYVLDTFGERICFLWGQSILALGFILLSIIKHSYAWYVFFMCLGISADLSFIPLLKLSKYFNKKESLIFGILGSARSTGFGIGSFLKIAFFYTFNFKNNEFYILCIFYLLTCSLFSFMVGLFIVPKKYNKISKIGSEIATGSSHTDKKPKVDMINDIDKIEMGNKTNTNLSSTNKDSLFEKIKILWSHKKKWEYLITTFICSTSMIKFDYFMKTNRSIFIWNNNDLTTIFSIATILSFIPTPLFGYLAGKFGSVYSIITNNTFGSLAYFLILFDSVYCRMASIFLFFLYISFLFSCFYCYIDEKYSKEHFGKLCGIMFAVSALFLFLNFYLTYLTNVVYINMGEKKYFPVVYGLNVLGVIALLSCIYLKVSEIREKKALIGA
ncbi:transporter, putative [Plasmodium berghei]|uniref:Major facilitator superfamily-related transporter, putative n=2 Tax=Plasmodium berghei TaxID=5821 RepID=A0A509AIL5_PLABA|nr:apicomplexan amino acid transporter ApiAT2, putative [Plasmodium berghei ANKA]CXI32183.1 transporter, putative [Plasmodium berghei]SCM21100.1 transporter, putative [Plasmodium berghei]SCN24462.1 transporter, putative [Plasmodium berghei]SCO59648.1 transporter, putative [Plasmodium berghei]SCO60825.1 transporter, putative [Plasmodium berghei]|eukprot:XP_034421129.1 apicomplexan amino acid transporter ApiAT2, putative [Plasmodium berghei ANKA]